MACDPLIFGGIGGDLSGKGGDVLEYSGRSENFEADMIEIMVR
jgi:hypothetical protein